MTSTGTGGHAEDGSAGAGCPARASCGSAECPLATDLEAAGLGLAAFDVAAGRLVFTNREAGVLFPRGADGSSAPVAGLAATVTTEASAERGEPYQIELDGRLFGYTVYGVGPLRWVFCRDISEKTHQIALAGAQELMEGFGSVFSAVRHELGNPVNSVKTTLSVLRRNLGRFPPETVAQYVDRCLTEVSRVEGLLRDLRSFQAEDAIVPAPLDLDRFVVAAAERLLPGLSSNGIELDILRGLPGVTALADGDVLGRILDDLVENSVDALKGRLSPRITLRTWLRSGRPVLRVEDNGIGIAAAARKALFHPFQSTRPGGSGLALVLARKLLAKMDATIEVESEEGEGTAVSVTLDRVEATA